MLNLPSWLEPYYAQFINALESSRLTGSLIIGGSYGQGAYILSLYCAKAYLCQHRVNSHPCNKCKSCITFEAMTHHDFRCVRPLGPKLKDAEIDSGDFSNKYDYLLNPELVGSDTRETLRVDALRQMNEYVYESSVSGPGKVCLIAMAQNMSEEAANALLKTFEEPPLNTLIIMVADNYENLLPTILSRALKMPIFAIDEKIALEYMQSNGYERELSLAALSLCANAPFKAELLIKNETAQRALEIRDMIYAYLQGRADTDDIMNVFAAVDFQRLHGILNALILQIIKYKAGVGTDNLALLESSSANAFAMIKADRLFEAAESLKYMKSGQTAMAIRAPHATLRTFLARLLG